MRFYAALLGFISCAMSGVVVSFFADHYLTNAIFGGCFGAILTFIFFKYEILPGDKVYDGISSQVLMSNAWIYWIGNFLTAIVLSAWYKIGYFWSGFISAGLSIVVAMIVIGIGAGALSNSKIS